MAPLLEDPRIRQRWNRISQNAESVTETAAANIWNFQHEYIHPCFASIAFGIEQCTGICFPDREERARRRMRGRAEASFDFYDDWDQEDHFKNHGLFGGWGTDELDRLLAGRGLSSGKGIGINQPPKRNRGMSYGTRERRRSCDHDPTIIPSTSALGFLGRLPFKLGGTLRYKPSAADLQDRPGIGRSRRRKDNERAPLIIDDDFDHNRQVGGSRRSRASIASSGGTSDSLRSRGDLFQSDEEDDAVPLSDEFSIVLERRITGSSSDDTSISRNNGGKDEAYCISTVFKPVSENSRSSSYSKVSIRGQCTSTGYAQPGAPTISSPAVTVQTPSLFDLQQENDRVTQEEEILIEVKRNAAAKLALQRGYYLNQAPISSDEIKTEVLYDKEVVEQELPGSNYTTEQTCEILNDTDLSNLTKPHSGKIETSSIGSIQPQFIPAKLSHPG